jgi:hypothetical protein
LWKRRPNVEKWASPRANDPGQAVFWLWRQWFLFPSCHAGVVDGWKNWRSPAWR